MSSSTKVDYEFSGAITNQPITQSVTTLTPDSYGNPASLQVQLTDVQVSSPYYGETYTTLQTNSFTPNTSTWCLGLPTQTTIQSTIPGPSSKTRTTSSTIDYTNCRAWQDVVEPSSATLKVTSTYEFDACGNVNKTRVVGKKPDGTDMAERVHSSTFGVRCTFEDTITNTLGQQTVDAYSFTGLRLSTTDPNGLMTSWEYDDHGRTTLRSCPDGSKLVRNFYFCDAPGYCGVSDLRWYMTEVQQDSAGSNVTNRYVFHDLANRIRYDERLNLAGGYTNFVVGYDSRGNRSIQYNPYSSSGTGYQTFEFDVQGRMTASRLYDSAGALDRQSSAVYAGRATTATDAKGFSTTRYNDVRGLLRRILDPAPGGTTNHSYDEFSNLVSTTDAVGVVSSTSYDARGFRTGSSDPHTGNWVYSSNSLGEVVCKLPGADSRPRSHMTRCRASRPGRSPKESAPGRTEPMQVSRTSTSSRTFRGQATPRAIRSIRRDGP